MDEVSAKLTQCSLGTPEDTVCELVECLYKRADLIGQFLQEYPSWLSRREESISSLDSIAMDFDKCVNDANAAKVAGSSGAIVGGVAMGVGAVLLPVTAGLSSALIAGGGAAAMAGGAVTGIADLVKSSITKSRCKAVDDVLKKDEESTCRLLDILAEVQKLSDRIKDILNGLRSGSMECEQKAETMQIMYSVAFVCGRETWIGRTLLVIYRSVSANTIPAEYCIKLPTYTKPACKKEFGNPMLTAVMVAIKATGLLPPVSVGKAVVKAAGLVPDSSTPDSVGAEDSLFCVEPAPSKESTTLDAVLALTTGVVIVGGGLFLTRSLSGKMIEAGGCELMAEEAAADVAMSEAATVEAEVTVDMVEMEAVEMTNLGLVASAAAALAGSVAVVGFSVYDLVSTTKEIREGSRVTKLFREKSSCLKKSRKKLTKVRSSLTLLQFDRKVLLFSCLIILRALIKVIARLIKDRKCLPIKTRCSVSSFVSVATFNIKGTVQNDQYKNFLKAVFEVLGCQLYHLQECIWGNPEVGSRASKWLYLLPGYDVNIRKERDGHVVKNYLDAGLASLERDIESVSEVSRISPYPERSCYYKFRTASVGNQSALQLEFLSFSFHGFHVHVSDKEKRESIAIFFDFVEGCCRDEGLPAIVGGDFNYDIRNMPPRLNVKIYGGTCPGHSSIDFLCIVCGSDFETKMAMVGEHVGYLDIERKMEIPGELKGEITNHVPYYGLLHLNRES